jgi:rubredoxin
MFDTPTTGTTFTQNIDLNYTYVEPDTVDSELLCVVCHDPLVIPVYHSQCQISLCLSCAASMNYKCPICSTGEKSDFLPVGARIIHNQLNRLKVMCNACGTVTNRGDFEEHTKKCESKCPESISELCVHVESLSRKVKELSTKVQEIDNFKRFLRFIKFDNFAKVNMSHGVFEHANFSEASVIDTNFTGAQLQNAKFGEEIKQTDFTDANLENSRFFNQSAFQKKYDKVCFRNTNLRGSTFYNLTLENTDFTGANLDGASFDFVLLDYKNTVGFDELFKAHLTHEHMRCSKCGFVRKGKDTKAKTGLGCDRSSSYNDTLHVYVNF